MRRTRLLGAQAELWPDWRHFACITNRDEDIALVEAEHREHAVVEQVIADRKDQALAHFPSGHYNANAASTVLAALAHNMLRWTQSLGLPDTTVRAARTLRRPLPEVPGRLTRHARGWTLAAVLDAHRAWNTAEADTRALLMLAGRPELAARIPALAPAINYIRTHVAQYDGPVPLPLPVAPAAPAAVLDEAA